MNIRILAKDEVLNGKEDVSEKILISITSTVETPIPDDVKYRYAKVLQLKFDDFNYDPNEYSDMKDFHGLSIFSYAHFVLIRRFIKDERCDIDVHCGAGISRSSAVAIGICLIRDDINILHKILRENPRIKPNKKVLSLMYAHANPRLCTLAFELIFWYQHKYHGRLSEVSPDTILDFVSLEF